MFQVGRYDPNLEEREKKAKAKKNQENPSGKKKKRGGKRKRLEDKSTATTLRNDATNEVNLKDAAGDDDDDNEGTPAAPKSSLYVIAPDTSNHETSKRGKSKLDSMPDEAFDDLEIVEDLLLETSQDDNDEEGEEEQPQAPTTRDSNTSNLSNEIRTALHMSSLPIRQAAQVWNLAPFLVDNLLQDGYETFFPIQSLVIPDVIASERHSHIRVRDVCVAAPTGSGKTLAFVIPILNSLANRQIQRLRALVVLPSRDLALQVFDVFDRYTKGSDLKVGIAIGQSDFTAEQRALTIGENEFNESDPKLVQLRALLDPTNIQLTLDAFSVEGHEDSNSLELPRGGISAIDVLVCTPGRLVDHLDNTPGFTLQHLRFLVIDEADRLLSQNYHNWIGRVISASNSASVAAWHELTDKNQQKSLEATTAKNNVSILKIDPITWRRGGVGGDDSTFNTNDAYSSSIVASVCQPVQLRKLLYSATLTRDPQKLTALGLVNPKHYDAHSLSSSSTTGGIPGRAVRYSIPASLLEYTVECTASQKPLFLLGLLLERTQSGGLAVVFTSSLDSTHSLARLLQLVWKVAGFGSPQAVTEYSSSLRQHQRTELVARCNDPNGSVSIVVCSDSMSRGMDIERVRTVINYDVPSFAKTYVHRCGRTARAGREGTALTLIKSGQARNFDKIRALIDEAERVQSMTVDAEKIRPTIPAYKQCIQALRGVLAAETDGDLDPLDPIPTDLFPSM